MAQRIKQGIFLMALAIMFLPLIQSFTGIIPIRPLNGFEQNKNNDSLIPFTIKSWTHELFQKQIEKQLNTNVGLRPLLIRLYNQIQYDLFRNTQARNVVIGKNHCLYEQGYIEDYIGCNFLGEIYLNELLRRTRMVQDTLFKASGTRLIVVYEPGKASFYPEYIPDRFLKQKTGRSNMDYLIQRSIKTGINTLDLKNHFIRMKDTAKYPLYATYGVHWSTYGMYVAADTLIRFVSNLCNKKLPLLVWKSFETSNQLVDADFDIESTLNLLLDLPHQTMCYPQIGYRSKGTTRPKLLTVGDSYYWGLISNHITDSAFSNHQYWYYFHGIWPDIWAYKNIPDEVNLREEVQKQEVILIVITELNAFNAFWGFTDALYSIYYPGDDNHEYEIMKKIIALDPDFQEHRRIAEKYQVSTHAVIGAEMNNASKLPYLR